MGFLLRILGDPGDLIRIRLHKRKMLKLKVRQTVGRAFTPDEKDRMLEEARKARSPHIFPALSLALNAGIAAVRPASAKHPESESDDQQQVGKLGEVEAAFAGG